MNADIVRFLIDTHRRMNKLADRALEHALKMLPEDGTPVEWDEDGTHFKAWREGSRLRVEHWGNAGAGCRYSIKKNVEAGRGPILGPPT